MGEDVTDMRQGGGADHRREGGGNLGWGHLTMGADQPLEVVTLRWGGEPKEGPARAMCRGAGSNWVQEWAAGGNGWGRLRERQAARRSLLHSSLERGVDLVVEMQNEEAVARHSHPAAEGSDHGGGPRIGKG